MRRAPSTALAVVLALGGASRAAVLSRQPRPAPNALRALAPERSAPPPAPREKLIRVLPPEPCAGSRDACASRELSENLRQIEGTAPQPERSSLLVPILAGAVIVLGVFSLEVYFAGR